MRGEGTLVTLSRKARALPIRERLDLCPCRNVTVPPQKAVQTKGVIA